MATNSGPSGASGSRDSLEKWVRENGGDDDLLELLRAYHDHLTHHMWINMDASEEETREDCQLTGLA